MDTRALGARGKQGHSPARLLMVLVLALCAVPAVPLAAGVQPPPALTFGVVRATLGSDGLSAPLRAPLPFSLVGIALPSGAAGAVRVSPDGRGWSPWLPFEQEGPGAGEPVWTGAALWLQVRGPAGAAIEANLVDSLGQAQGTLDRAGALLAAAGTAIRAALRPEPAAAAPARPAIVTRAGWGADERLRRGGPRYADGVRALIVHHTAGGNDYRPEEGPAVVRAIYGYHTRVLGWNDIGYHLLADRHGRLYEGRAGGVERPVVGAHAGGFNQHTSGIAVIGSYQDAAPPPAAMRALVDVLAWKAGVHGIDPRGSAELRSGGSTRYPAGARPRIATISGHRDVSRTACPGQALYGLLPEVREAVARRMSGTPFPGGLLELAPIRRS